MKKNVFLQSWGFAQNKMISISLMVLALLLSGCTHHRPEPLIILHKKPLAEIRQDYIDVLKASGVQVILLGETIRIVIPSDQLFNAESANLNVDYAESVLPTTADLIHTYDTVSVDVDAYSDSIYQGKPYVSKLALTKRQSQAVANNLWATGLNTRLLVARGHGDRFPVALPNSFRGQAFNRRVEIFFYYYPRFCSYD